MFDVVRNNQKFVQIVLFLIIITFVFFGVGAYQSTQKVVIAKIGKYELSQTEFDYELRRQREQLTRQLGERIDPAMLSGPVFRKQVLDEIVNRRLLSNFIADNYMVASDADLQKEIQSIEAFQENGKFSLERYRELLLSSGNNEITFENQMRNDLMLNQINNAIGAATINSTLTLNMLVNKMLEKRSLQLHVLPLGTVLATQTVSDEEIKKYYDSHKSNFQQEAKYQFAYVQLSKKTLAAKLSPSESELNEWLKANKDQLAGDQRRHVRHILFTLDKDAKQSDVDAAMKKAADVRTEIIAGGAQMFAEAAKKYSQDPGSADKGGDLGAIAKGELVAPVEKAVFAQAVGEISQPIRSEYGIHLLEVTSIEGEKLDPPLEHQKAREKMIEQQVKKLYAEKVVEFSNLAYEQSDTLKSVADHFGLSVNETALIGKSELMAPLNVKAVRDELFHDEVLKEGRNSKAIDAGEDSIVSARLVKSEPARLLALNEVKEKISAILVREKAGKALTVQGGKLLDELKAGNNVAITWTPETTSTRDQTPLPPALLNEVFAAEPLKVPAYFGGSMFDESYALVKLSAVEKATPEQLKQAVAGMQQQFKGTVAQRDFMLFVNGLKKYYPVEIKPAFLAENAAEESAP